MSFEAFHNSEGKTFNHSLSVGASEGFTPVHRKPWSEDQYGLADPSMGIEQARELAAHDKESTERKLAEKLDSAFMEFTEHENEAS